MTLRAAGLVLSIVAFMAPGAGAQSRLEGAVEVFNGEVAPGAWFRIRDLNGAIEVHEATGRNVVVSATRRFTNRSNGEIKFDVKRDGSNVTVCAIWPSTYRCDANGYDSENRSRNDSDVGRVDFVVSLPRGVKLVAATGNGTVDIRNTGTEVEARSGNGEVTVIGAGGSVVAVSGNGDIDVDGAHGEVEARSGNGDIKVSTSAGPVSATTGNGRIDVQMASLTSGGDMEFSTGNGSIEVSFPPTLSAVVEANVSYSSLRTDFPMEMAARWNTRHVEGKIANGGRRIRFSTGNGRVTIRKNG